MSLTIAFVGAKDSVKMIEKVAQEFRDKIRYISLPYEDKNSTVDLVRSNMDKVDIFLFSGRVPYNIAMGKISIPKPCFYIPHNGSAIYKALWEIGVKGNITGSISFDTIKATEVEEVFEELDIEHGQIYSLEYDGDIDYKELANYHFELWKTGKTKGAVTCLLATYKILAERGVPVYRAVLTKSLIRQTLEKAISQGKALILQEKELKLEQMAETLASTIEEITASIDEISNTAQIISQDNYDLLEKTERTKESTEKTDAILSYIKKISDKSNILGLNAAIEAARVGESGKGFAVVAQEIRQLSIQTKDSVSSISTILSTMNESVGAIVSLISKTAQATQEQAATIEQIKAAIDQISSSAQELSEFANSNKVELFD